jgi:CRP/FNR family transcriptional regulator
MDNKVIAQNWINGKLFSNLSGEALKKLVAFSRFVNFSDGQLIFAQGDDHTPVYYVTLGAVRVFRVNSEGREQTLSYINPGEAFNIPTVFFDEPLAPACAAAFGDSELLSISQHDFSTLSSENPEIALAVLKDLSQRLQHMTNLVHNVSLRTVRGRLAHFLLSQAKSNTSSTNWTQEQIAAQIGTSREVVSRAFRSLIRDGLIISQRQQITIPDPKALEMESDE